MFSPFFWKRYLVIQISSVWGFVCSNILGEKGKNPFKKFSDQTAIAIG